MERQTYQKEEKYEALRNRHTQICSTPFFLTKIPKQLNGGKIAFSTSNDEAVVPP